jgi:predicted TPR repeat methyltransferase
MSDTGPLFVSSGDLIADRRYKWALDQAARGDFVAAADILAQTVALAPGFATAWFALGAISDRLGDRAGAVAAFEKARDADTRGLPRRQAAARPARFRRCHTRDE